MEPSDVAPTKAHDLEGVVFERRLPWAYAIAFAIVVVPALSLAWWSGDLASTAGRMAAGLPWVDRPSFAWIGRVVCVLAPLLVTVVAVGWTGRRFGRAVVTREHVVVTPIWRGFRPIVVPRVDVVALGETPFGLALVAPAARRGLRALVLPAFVPASDADLARAHELLDPAQGVARSDACTSSRVLSILTWVAVAAPLCLFAGVALVSKNLDLTATRVACIAAALLVALGWFAAGVGRRRVHLGAESVSVGSLCGPWTSVARLWTWGAWFALELQDGRRQHARVGVEASARWASLAGASLTALGRDVAIARERPRWITRLWVTFAAGSALLLAVYLEAGPIAALTRQGCFGLEDHHGYQLRLVYRAHDAAPQLVVIVDPGVGGKVPPHVDVQAGAWRSHLFWDVRGWRPRVIPESVRVDVPGGKVRCGTREYAISRDATVVHVRADGVAFSTRPLPVPVPAIRPTRAKPLPSGWAERTIEELDMLDLWLPGSDDPVLRDVLDGRTATRCFASATSDGFWLYTQAHGGEVSATLIESGKPEWRRGGRCEACPNTRRARGHCVRVDPASSLFVLRTAPTLTLEQLLETQRLVRSGVAVFDTPLRELARR